MAKQVTVASIIRKLYVDDSGTLVEVKQIDNPEDYAKGITVYTKEAVKGVSKGASIYAVAVVDFIAKKRVSAKESIESMLASGMDAVEIVDKLMGR